MTKKHFIELADYIRTWNNGAAQEQKFTQEQIDHLAHFCKTQNSNFLRERWIDYIDGSCGKNGGKVSGAASKA